MNVEMRRTAGRVPGDTMHPDILTWEAAAGAGPGICGGKGFRLGQLFRYGFAVPRGGVIPVAWYDGVLARVPAAALAAVASASAEMALESSIASALAEIRHAIETTDLSGALAARLAAFLETHGLERCPMAVRSSATAEDGARASFAGIHHSVLHVSGREATARAVAACYASLWTPRALAYRRRMGFGDDEVRCAVVVCEMVRAAGREAPLAAGVAFTCDPLTGRRDLIVIDAAPGAGEAVVSGATNPRRVVFRVEKGRAQLESRDGVSATGTAGATRDARVRESDGLLPPAREQELADLLLRLHWALGDGQDPQDVEWAFDGRTIWLLQARPATSVRRVSLPMPVSAPVPRYWSTANIKDALPGVVSMLSWSLIAGIAPALAFAAATTTGYVLPPGVELTRRMRGRAYFDLTCMQWVMYDALGVSTAEFAEAIGGHQPQIPLPPHPLRGAAGRRRQRARLRLMRRVWRLDRELAARLASQAALLRPWLTRDLAPCSREELGRLMDDVSRAHARLDETVGLANSAEGPWEQALMTMLRPLFGAETRTMLGRLLAGTGAVTSAEHGYAIFQLADAARTDPAALAWLDAPHGARPVVAAARTGRGSWRDLPAASPFRAALVRFLDDYGHRAVYEADLLNPRWAEDPSYILDQVRHALSNPTARQPRDAARRRRDEAERELRRRAGWRAPVIFWLVRRLRAAMAMRETAKSGLVASLLPLERVFLEIGRRLVLAGHLDDPRQVLHLSSADLTCWLEGWWDGRGARALADDRARQRDQWLAEAEPADVLTDDEAIDGRIMHDIGMIGITGEPVAAAAAAGAAERWTGIAAAPGHARGRARVIRHPHDSARLSAGDVLVAPSTDPGWTPLFLRASAIVMEVGGYLSHGAIVAREYGLPAVVNLPGIFGALRDGDELIVDGDAGIVSRVARMAHAGEPVPLPMQPQADLLSELNAEPQAQPEREREPV